MGWYFLFMHMMMVLFGSYDLVVGNMLVMTEWRGSMIDG
jgi:hypothetical protein